MLETTVTDCVGRYREGELRLGKTKALLLQNADEWEQAALNLCENAHFPLKVFIPVNLLLIFISVNILKCFT